MDWDTYLERLGEFASQAEDSLSRGEAFTWPDLALPRGPATTTQRRRAAEIRNRMVTVLDSAQGQRNKLARELSRLARTGPPTHRSTEVYGGSLDVTG
jgi:hypothetical protein